MTTYHLGIHPFKVFACGLHINCLSAEDGWDPIGPFQRNTDSGHYYRVPCKKCVNWLTIHKLTEIEL